MSLEEEFTPDKSETEEVFLDDFNDSDYTPPPRD